MYCYLVWTIHAHVPLHNDTIYLFNLNDNRMLLISENITRNAIFVLNALFLFSPKWRNVRLDVRMFYI